MQPGELTHPEEHDASREDICLSDGSRLTHWEEAVAANMIPGVDLQSLESWSTRPRLSDLLRSGLNFSGSLQDIQIVAEPAARETLVETLSQEPKPRLATDYFNKPGNCTKILPEHMRSFLVSASAYSVASSEKIDDIYAQIWYEIVVNPRKPDQVVDVRRYVTRPVADEAAFRQLVQRSKIVGQLMLRASMSQPYSNGMSGLSQGETTRKPRRYRHSN